MLFFGRSRKKGRGRQNYPRKTAFGEEAALEIVSSQSKVV